MACLSMPSLVCMSSAELVRRRGGWNERARVWMGRDGPVKGESEGGFQLC